MYMVLSCETHTHTHTHTCPTAWQSLNKNGLALNRKHDRKNRKCLFCKGWLSKQGKNFKTWNNRFFLLFSNGMIEYYTEEIDTKSLLHEHNTSLPSINSNTNSNSSSSSSSSSSNSSMNSNSTAQPTEDNSLSVHSEESDLKRVLNGHDNGHTVIDEELPQPQVLLVDETAMKKSSKCNNPNSCDVSDEEDTWEIVLANKDTLEEEEEEEEAGKQLKPYGSVRPQGVIELKQMIETQWIDFVNEPSQVYGFAIVTKDRSWKFKCKSDDLRRQWIAAIHSVIYGLSPEDFHRYSLEISYQNNTFIYRKPLKSF
ncbi:hypothetical protein RFI_23883, partial [Reticulomyxa filosa]